MPMKRKALKSSAAPTSVTPPIQLRYFFCQMPRQDSRRSAALSLSFIAALSTPLTFFLSLLSSFSSFRRRSFSSPKISTNSPSRFSMPISLAPQILNLRKSISLSTLYDILNLPSEVFVSFLNPTVSSISFPALNQLLIHRS